MGDAAWVGEWLTQFLKSPLWTAPINSFIDTHCGDFVDCDEEENKLSYTSTYKEFCELVDKVLSENLAEMGVSQDVFLAVIGDSANCELDALVKEYLLAMEDFPTFRKMMEKRNIELELETLNMEVDEDEINEKLYNEWQRQAERLTKELEMEDAELQHAMAISIQLAEEERKKKEEEITKSALDKTEQEVKLEEVKKEHEQTVQQINDETLNARVALIERKAPETQVARENAAKPNPPPPPPPPPAPAPAPEPVREAEKKPEATPKPEKPTTSTKPSATLDKVEIPRSKPQPLPPLSMASAQFKKPLPGLGTAKQPTFQELQKAVTSDTAPSGPSDDEVKRREAYLKAQRDLLIERKKAQRQKELDEFVKDKKGTMPQPPPEVQKAVPKKPELDPEQVEMRRALAQRVKEDLVG